jgi:hypothetical protein
MLRCASLASIGWTGAVGLLATLLTNCVASGSNGVVAQQPPISQEPRSCTQGHGYGGLGALPKVDGGTAEGRFERRDVAKVVARQRAAFKACFVEAAAREPERELYLRLGVLVSPDGTVRSTTVAYASVEDPSLDECVGHVLCGMDFPRSIGRATARAFFPMEFRRGVIESSCYIGHRTPSEVGARPAQPRGDADAPDGGSVDAVDNSRPRGTLDKDVIRGVIRSKLDQVRFCYAAALTANSQLAGRVAVQFTIGPTGQVIDSGIQSTTMNHDAVEDCIGRTVCDWRFPEPIGGGTVIVSYPFNFIPST